MKKARKKIIFLELNEVPHRVFVDSFKTLNYRIGFNQLKYIPTISRDETHLSPWTTWPTVHRGVTYSKHLIGDLGQDLTASDKKYPPIWSVLQSKGYEVGVFGSLHSSHMEESKMANFSFFIPDLPKLLLR